MPKINRPRRGSLAFSPRKRAKSPIPKYQSWPVYEGAPILQGFAGYKVGMTHVIMVDDHKNSPTEGKEIMVPVTVIEVPSMKVAAIRAYSKDTYGKHAFTDVWADQLDAVLGRRITLPKEYNGEEAKKKLTDAVAAGTVAEMYAVTYTQPAALSGVPKKVPDLMEIKVGGADMKKQMDFALGLLGKEVALNNVVQTGAYADITAITTGKGNPGCCKTLGYCPAQAQALCRRQGTPHRYPRAMESPPRTVAGSPDRPDGIPAAHRVQQADPEILRECERSNASRRFPPLRCPQEPVCACQRLNTRPGKAADPYPPGECAWENMSSGCRQSSS